MFPGMKYWERRNIPSKAFLPKMHNLNQIMKKKKNPKWKTNYKTAEKYCSKVSISWKTKKDWELSQIRRDQGDAAMKCNVKTMRKQTTDWEKPMFHVNSEKK